MVVYVIAEIVEIAEVRFLGPRTRALDPEEA
jgi:hypothetical protein